MPIQMQRSLYLLRESASLQSAECQTQSLLIRSAKTLMLSTATRYRIDRLRTIATSEQTQKGDRSSASGQCGRGWSGNKGQCRRAQLKRIAKLKKTGKKVGKEAKHIGEHLGENVAAWGVGKVVGGAIAQVGVKHGLDPVMSKQVAESAVQALTGTLIHARKKENRNLKELSTYFIAQSAAAYLGKNAHSAFDESMFLKADDQVRSIAAMAAGKGTGMGTMSGAKRTLNKLVDRFTRRTDAMNESPLTEQEHEALFTLTLYGILKAQNA